METLVTTILSTSLLGLAILINKTHDESKPSANPITKRTTIIFTFILGFLCLIPSSINRKNKYDRVIHKLNHYNIQSMLDSAAKHNFIESGLLEYTPDNDQKPTLIFK